MYTYPIRSDELFHHGILKQKWGVRNGPPYPLSGGDYSPAEKKAIYAERKRKKYSLYNKKHFDETLEKGTEMTTLAHRPNKTQVEDYFFAAHNKFDKHWYNAMFNRPYKDVSGNTVLKYAITNKAIKNIDVASEDSGADMFKQLYKNDRDFYNFVTDKDRMRRIFNYDKKQWKGYKKAQETLLEKDQGKEMTEEDVNTMYRMFNYVITTHDKDAITQKKKFFELAKQNGYEALLDTNDGVYGGYKTRHPIIVIDPESVILSNAERTTLKSKRFSALVAIGGRILGLE